MITIRPKVEYKVPIEAECISPDAFSGLSSAEVGKLEILWGNKKKDLGEVFSVEDGPGKPSQIVLDGDAAPIKHLGAKMSKGKLVIKGNAGMHLGRQMTGGEIIVEGDAAGWLGAEMKGGLIRVEGSAGDLVGSAYRGSKTGMKGGAIVIKGDAGSETGELMSGGSIGIVGSVGTFAGTLMSGGLIACLGSVGERAGAGMTNGTVLTLKRPKLLPTFKFTRVYNPKLLRPRLEELKKGGFPIGKKQIEGLYERYEGDLASEGKGRVIVWKSPPQRSK
jgi:formylmethanofuran dehydrogenase subunit C